jgi:hypothetical protein
VSPNQPHRKKIKKKNKDGKSSTIQMNKAEKKKLTKKSLKNRTLTNPSKTTKPRELNHANKIT